MKVEMQQSEKSEGLIHSKWDIAIVGEALDDRGKAAIDFVLANTKESCSIKYEPADLQISVNNKKYDIDDFESALSFLKGKRVVIESTTTGFVEILLAAQSIKNSGAVEITFVYVEPESYRKKQKNLFLHRREFDLSGEVVGFRPIPGYMKMFSYESIQKVVFFPGFESARMDRAFEDNPLINSKFCSLAFGVPAFKAGWEMDSFANNIDMIRERKIAGGVYFCGAADPYAAYCVLKEIHKGLASEETMQVAPIGTKPSGIGTILFAITHPEIGLLFDHPNKEGKRTDKISSWHIFDVKFDL